MLTALWGVGSRALARRSSRAAASSSVKPAPVVVQALAPAAVAEKVVPAVIAQPMDPFALAQAAADRAEARARAALAQEQAFPAASEDALLAREDLERELALRAIEREQEAAARSRAEAAAVAHEAAQRELAALEALLARARREREDTPMASDAVLARGRPTVPRQVAPAPSLASVEIIAAPVAEPVVVASPPVIADAVAPAPIVSAPTVSAPVAPALPRAEADDAEMARFPGLTDRRLVGAILGLPGALGYWGNTIMAHMRLDGTAQSGSAMRVDGVIDGACAAPVLFISEGASVTGVVAAETIVVLGRVSGVLSGRNVFVAASARVEGDVFYQTMYIDPQAHCDVRFSRLPAASDPIEVGSTVYLRRAA